MADAQNQVVEPKSTFPASMTPDPNSIVDTLKTMGMDSSRANIANLYEKAGLGTKADYLAAGSNNAVQNEALNNYYKTGAGKPAPVGIVTSNQSKSNYNDNVASMNKAVSTTTGYMDYSKDPNGVRVDNNESPKTDTPKVPEGLDPETKKQYQDSIDLLTTQQQDAKATLESAKATLQNDPAATAAIDAISRKYDVLINNMNMKNKIVLGSYSANAARSGSLQFANEMTSSFMSNEMDRANQRVADLVAQEQEMILKTKQAYKDGDVKALAEATKAYNDINRQKFDEIDKLVKATNEAVKTSQAELKRVQTEKNQTITNDIKLATNVAQSLADHIASSGETDKTKIDAFIDEVAQNNGISNPEILRSAVIKAQQTNKTLDLKNQNTQSIINKRGRGNHTTFKASAEIPSVTDSMDKNKGDDGFVNPNSWVAARKIWMDKGGTAASFKSNFIQYLNPSDYKVAGYKPPATTSEFVITP